MLNKNKIFSIVLGISHFFTDAIVSFSITFVSLNFYNYKSNLFYYIIIYNLIAFGLQIIVGYFLDKIKENYKNFVFSKYMILISFIFYLVGLGLLFKELFLLSFILIGFGSCFFHIGGGNISLLSFNDKASNLGIFASGGVIGLSFGWWLSYYFSSFYFLFYIFLIALGIIIYFYDGYKIENNINKQITKEYSYEIIFIISLLLILSFRSAIWTNFQEIYLSNKETIFYLAVSAFLGKIIGGFFKDSKYFKNKYLLGILFFSILFLLINSFFYENIILLLLGIFLITTLLIPITIMIYEKFKNKRGIIIGYAFGFSLILGFFIYKGVYLF